MARYLSRGEIGGTEKRLTAEKKGSGPLEGPLDLTGTKTTRAYVKLFRLADAEINPHRMKVGKPASTGLPVGVTYGVARGWTSSATVAHLGHDDWPPCIVSIRLEHCII